MPLSHYLEADESHRVQQRDSFTAPFSVSLTSLSHLGPEVKPVTQSSAALSPPYPWAFQANKRSPFYFLIVRAVRNCDRDVSVP